MNIFKQDILYDLKTKNTSFIEMHQQLKDAGIKNNKFFLRIYDNDLISINPFDTDLSHALKTKIKREVSRNPWYYLRECVRIPTIDGTTDTPFKLHIGNLASLYCTLNGLDHYSSYPRQQYRSVSYGILLHWIFTYGGTNIDFSYMNICYESFRHKIDLINEQVSMLPEYLINNSINVFDDGKYIENFISKNSITYVRTGNDNYNYFSNVDCIPIGHIQFFDDFEHIPNIRKIIGKSIHLRSEKLKRSKGYNNIKPCSIYTTTMGDPKTNPSAAYGLGLLELSLPWSNTFYDFTADEIENQLNINSPVKLLSITPSYQDLGLDDKWFNNMSRALNNNTDKINREILLNHYSV